MSEFPAIDDVEDVPVNTETENETDFLAREKELVGDEFKTEQDDELLKQNQQEEDEVEKFEQDFPSLEGDAGAGAGPAEAQAAQQQDEDEFDDFAQPVFNPPSEESTEIKEWKQRFNLEIQERDEIDAKKTEEAKQAAAKQLDDFYDDYNTKKDEAIEKAKAAQEEFLSKRDEFYSKGNVWSRALELVKDGKSNARFKELLETKVKLSN